MIIFFVFCVENIEVPANSFILSEVSNSGFFKISKFPTLPSPLTSLTLAASSLKGMLTSNLNFCYNVKTKLSIFAFVCYVLISMWFKFPFPFWISIFHYSNCAYPCALFWDLKKFPAFFMTSWHLWFYISQIQMQIILNANFGFWQNPL